MTPEEFHNDFFRNYRGRYSSYWIERWGLIPSIPTSFDNANSIYELLAWLQRAFKQLLDDFVALESEFEDYKNALTELLEYLVPLLIRRYMESKEADDWFNKKADIYYNKIIKPYIDNEINKVNQRIDREVAGLNQRIDREVAGLNERINREVAGLNERINRENNQLRQEIQTLKEKGDEANHALQEIVRNLKRSGAWSGDLTGGFKEGRNLATGNINIFGGTPDGESFIRTNSGKTENDLAGGI